MSKVLKLSRPTQINGSEITEMTLDLDNFRERI